MLKLLLDEQISPQVARGLRRVNPAARITCLAEWEAGRFIGMPDEAILQQAAVESLTLVTYDRRTIPPLLKRWAEAGRSHGGIIFVDNRTIPSSNFGGLIRALAQVMAELGKEDWADAVIFL